MIRLHSHKRLFSALVAASCGLAAVGFLTTRSHNARAVADSPAVQCSKHAVSNCPFCNPELIKSLGFCAGHDVPEALCTRCNAAVIPAFKAESDWCDEHGLPESQCIRCNPAVRDRWASMRPGKGDAATERDPNRLWCREHSVYEDECFICHPELAQKRPTVKHDESAPLGPDAAPAGLWCNEHKVAELQCGICQPQLASRLRAGEGLKVRLPSRASAKKAGIRVGKPRMEVLDGGPRFFCEARYDENRLARITPLVSGVIHKVHADVGQTVESGTLLVEIASVEVAVAKRDYLFAIVDERLKKLAHERELQLAEKEISAARNYQLAQAEYEKARIGTFAARQTLLNFGFTDEEADEVARTHSSSSIVHVHAPFTGTLVTRSAVMGEAVKPGAPLFTLADLSSMWLTLSIPESRISMAKVGMAVEATFAAVPDLAATGKITWIDSSVTEPSRLIQARAVVGNPDRLLRNNMFGEARVVADQPEGALTIPVSALQRFEKREFVFVRLDEDLYELRRVTVGARDRTRVQVVAGVRSDDPVVVRGSFTMMSEFLKSRLGAGCVDD